MLELGVDTAGPEHDEGSELRVVVDPHDELDAGLGHALHHCSAHGVAERIAHAIERFAHRVRSGQSEHHSPDVALVHQLGGGGFHSHGVADVSRRDHRIRRGCGVAGRHRRDPVVREDRERRFEPEPTTLGPTYELVGHAPARTRPVDGEVDRHPARTPPPIAEPRGACQGPRRGFRVLERRHAPRRQTGPSPNRIPSHTTSLCMGTILARPAPALLSRS